MKKKSLKFALLCFLITPLFFLSLAGCGKKGAPLPPLSEEPEKEVVVE
ncbi:MAG: hypothetical protein KAT46_04770 [Deltaproteobacteria bacterium]|nr:hypothetical protein [Deltaproteobacteria bacterium]